MASNFDFNFVKTYKRVKHAKKRQVTAYELVELATFGRTFVQIASNRVGIDFCANLD